MAARTYPERVIVLRKTRLREADLILTLLAEDGRQVRAVAKGALKPTGSFASRLELYSCADVLLVEGRSLDIVKEAKLVDAHAMLRFDYNRSICAAPMAELLALATQDELPVARLFPMTQAALSCLEQSEERILPLVMCAYLLKAASILGFRPSLANCAECGTARQRGMQWSFSYVAGGVVCPECPASYAAKPVPASIVDWADALIHATFDQVAAFAPDNQTLEGVLAFTQSWLQEHIGDLRSLSFCRTQLHL